MLSKSILKQVLYLSINGRFLLSNYPLESTLKKINENVTRVNSKEI